MHVHDVWFTLDSGDEFPEDKIGYGRVKFMRTSISSTTFENTLSSLPHIPSSELTALEYDANPSVINTWVSQLDHTSVGQCGFQLWNVSILTQDYVGKASFKLGVDLSSIGINIGTIVQLEATLAVSFVGDRWAISGNPYQHVSWDFSKYVTLFAGQYISDSVFALNTGVRNNVQAWTGMARAVGKVISQAASVLVVAEVNLELLEAGVLKSYISNYRISASANIRVSTLSETGEWIEEERHVTPSSLAVLPGSPPSSDLSDWDSSE